MKKSKKAVGVRVIDEVTMKTTKYFARIIFLNAPAVASTARAANYAVSEMKKGNL